MYHRFNETEYPSTNIQMDIFKKHIQIIKESNFNFQNPNKFKEQFSTIRLKKEIQSRSLGYNLLNLKKKYIYQCLCRMLSQ